MSTVGQSFVDSTIKKVRNTTLYLREGWHFYFVIGPYVHFVYAPIRISKVANNKKKKYHKKGKGIPHLLSNEQAHENFTDIINVFSFQNLI